MSSAQRGVRFCGWLIIFYPLAQHSFHSRDGRRASAAGCALVSGPRITAMDGLGGAWGEGGRRDDRQSQQRR